MKRILNARQRSTLACVNSRARTQQPAQPEHQYVTEEEMKFFGAEVFALEKEELPVAYYVGPFTHSDCRKLAGKCAGLLIDKGFSPTMSDLELAGVPLLMMPGCPEGGLFTAVLDKKSQRPVFSPAFVSTR